MTALSQPVGRSAVTSIQVPPQPVNRRDTETSKSDDQSKDSNEDFETALRKFASAGVVDDAGSKKSASPATKEKKSDDPAKAAVAPVQIPPVRGEVLPLTLALPLTMPVDVPMEGTQTDAIMLAGNDALLSELPQQKPEPLSTPDMIEESSSIPEKTELAFAAKLTPEAKDQTAPSAPTSPKAPAAPIQKPATQARIEPLTGEAQAARANAAPESIIKPVIAFHAETATHSTPAASHIEQAPPINSVSASARLEQVLEARSAPPANPSDFMVRIADAERGTDIRFVERAGEVHVSVRTADTTMAQTLRSGLTDFSARLEQGGIKAEMWRPGSGDAENRGHQDDNGRKSGDQRSAQRDRQAAAQEDSQRDSKKPKWVEAMELSIERQA
jgi:hypothetical protein